MASSLPVSGESSASSSSTRDVSRQNRTANAAATEGIKAKVSSACDSCKRRKVKCSGSQPCERCVSSRVVCTYGSSSGRYVHRTSDVPSLAITRLLMHRTTAVSYTRHLEEKVSELQALLRQQPALAHEDQFAQMYQFREQTRDQLIDTLAGPEDDYIFMSPHDSTSFHGRFAGLSMLRTVRDLCTTVSGTTDTPAGLSGRALAEAFDSTALDLPSYNRMAQFALLPSRERLQKTIAIALDCALNCKECVDRQQLDRQIQHLYERDPEDYTEEDRRALGLFYALMALGRRHEPEAPSSLSEAGPDMIVLKGVTYFRAARAIIDTTDCHDLNSIRALIIMASYLLSSSMLSKAYAYVCTAAAASLRMGLHVSSPAIRSKFTSAELTERRQVFAVLNLIDVFVSSALGMPNILRDADPDQLIPCPEDELYDMGTTLVAREPASPISETILEAKLFLIQAKVLQDYFPMANLAEDEGKHQIHYQQVADREAELQQWHEALPEMSPTTVETRVLRSQLLLRFSYASVQITLYRPFLLHVIRDKTEPGFSYQGFALGSACLRAATQAVWLIDSMDRHGYLHEAQWYNIYTLALAASALTLFVLGTKVGPTVDESWAAARRARELLSKLATKNVSARRCYESLAQLPEELPSQHAALQQQQQQPPPPPPPLGHAGDMSPRTQFMLGIGAIDPAVLPQALPARLGAQSSKTGHTHASTNE